MVENVSDFFTLNPYNDDHKYYIYMYLNNN